LSLPIVQNRLLQKTIPQLLKRLKAPSPLPPRLLVVSMFAEESIVALRIRVSLSKIYPNLRLSIRKIFLHRTL